jgi:Fur family zinc uptake transcriptional regulator
MSVNPDAGHACGHARPAKPTKAATAAAMAHARALFDAKGIRWTRPRQRALELLVQAGEPVKAYDLIAGFSTDGATAPPTVYRALDALLELGLVHRIPSINAFVACRHAGDHQAASFLICDCCGVVEEVAIPTQEIGAALERQRGFRATSIAIEVRGLCSRCKA